MKAAWIPRERRAVDLIGLGGIVHRCRGTAKALVGHGFNQVPQDARLEEN